jgi:hypothetical protein
MMRLFNQMLSRPVAAFTSGIELLGQRMKSSQRIDGVVSRIVHALTRTPSGSGSREEVKERMQEGLPALLAGPRPETQVEAAPEARDEVEGAARRTLDLIDTDLSGEILKLVRYQVLFVRRDYEHAFAEKESLIAESLDDEAFTAWKIAEFMQELKGEETPVPEMWRKKNYPPLECIRHGKLVDLPPEDRKYLRLQYRVLERYPRRKFEYEKEQISVLKQIRSAMENGDGAP